MVTPAPYCYSGALGTWQSGWVWLLETSADCLQHSLLPPSSGTCGVTPVRERQQTFWLLWRHRNIFGIQSNLPSLVVCNNIIHYSLQLTLLSYQQDNVISQLNFLLTAAFLSRLSYHYFILIFYKTNISPSYLVHFFFNSCTTIQSYYIWKRSLTTSLGFTQALHITLALCMTYLYKYTNLFLYISLFIYLSLMILSVDLMSCQPFSALCLTSALRTIPFFLPFWLFLYFWPACPWLPSPASLASLTSLKSGHHCEM